MSLVLSEEGRVIRADLVDGRPESAAAAHVPPTVRGHPGEQRVVVPVDVELQPVQGAGQELPRDRPALAYGRSITSTCRQRIDSKA